MGDNALIYKVIIPAVFFLVSSAVTQSFSEDHKNDALIQEQSVAKANEVTTASPKAEDEKIAQVQETKLPPAALKTEEEPKAQKSEKPITVKTKAKKGKAVAKASRKAKVKAKHKRHAKAKAKQHRVVAAKVKEEKTVAEARMAAEKQEQARLESVKVEEGSKAAPKASDSPLKDSTLMNAEVAPIAKPVKALLQVGQALPNFSIATESGQTVALEDYRGDVLLIEFFETGCQTCRSYLPHLDELNKKFGKQGLQIIGMSIDQNPMIQMYASDNHIVYPLVHANETIKAEFGIHAVPVIYVVDARGRVAGVFKGTSDQTPVRMEKLVKELLRGLYKLPA